ncbi:hypothetical protein [Leucobacter japonicus]|uniref:hypothetical protein n=1 Tax=Leucobacter japonicus TaxID=1461259 RepID=UPI0006A7E1D5|nr:hypothetical protein [Leucobacter japonicus]
MAGQLSLLESVCKAQTANSMLRGQALNDAACALADFASHGNWHLLAVDFAAERIIGSAVTIDPYLLLVDRTRRFDGCKVLLVAAHSAGEVGINISFRHAMEKGAALVEVARFDTFSSCFVLPDASQPRALDFYQ